MKVNHKILTIISLLPLIFLLVFTVCLPLNVEETEINYSAFSDDEMLEVPEKADLTRYDKFKTPNSYQCIVESKIPDKIGFQAFKHDRDEGMWMPVGSNEFNINSTIVKKGDHFPFEVLPVQEDPKEVQSVEFTFLPESSGEYIVVFYSKGEAVIRTPVFSAESASIKGCLKHILAFILKSGYLLIHASYIMKDSFRLPFISGGESWFMRVHYKILATQEGSILIYLGLFFVSMMILSTVLVYIGNNKGKNNNGCNTHRILYNLLGFLVSLDLFICLGLNTGFLEASCHLTHSNVVYYHSEIVVFSKVTSIAVTLAILWLIVLFTKNKLQNRDITSIYNTSLGYFLLLYFATPIALLLFWSLSCVFLLFVFGLPVYLMDSSGSGSSTSSSTESRDNLGTRIAKDNHLYYSDGLGFNYVRSGDKLINTTTGESVHLENSEIVECGLDDTIQDENGMWYTREE